MPAVPAPAKVLVTGASGFIATHVVKTLLGEGYTVVGTVRSPKKGDYLKDLFKSDKFSYVIVEDIEKTDAFDEVVKSGNFDAIEHTASPFTFAANDPDELIRPAVRGTTGILNSALNFGPTVKRIVVTSSVSAIIQAKPPNLDGSAYTFTEADWNTASPRAVDEKGSKASQVDKYNASKTLAERAAWEFLEKNKEQGVKFDLVTINPPFVFGPTMHEMRGVDALNQSNALFRRAIKLKQDNPEDQRPLAHSSPELSGAYIGNFTDVRIVALAHTRALQKEEAAGNRFIVSAGTFSWQDIYDALNNAGVQDVPKGFPGSQQRNKFNLQDGSKAARVLGIEYMSLQQTVVDTLSSLKERFPEEMK